MRISTETESIKQNQTKIWKLKNIVTELENSIEGFKSRFNKAEGKNQ